MNNKEMWKDIKDYEGLYQISNFGKVKSLYSNRLLKLPPTHDGYLIARLYKNSQRKTVYVHHLVWDSFGDKPRNGRILQIDHIDNNPQNNCIQNLQVLTARENTIKCKVRTKDTGKYVGVSTHKSSNKFRSRIFIDGKQILLGYFNNKMDAYTAYQNKLLEITKTERSPR